MKRFTALLLVFLLSFSCGIPALADGTVETWEQMGFTLTYPEEFSHTKGLVLPCFRVVEQSGINTMLFMYFTFSREESDAYNEKTRAGGLSAEDTARIQQAQGTLLIALSIDGGRGASELAEVMSLSSTNADSLTPIKQVGDISYFALTGPNVDPEYLSRIPEEYREEYLSLQSALVEVLKNAEYFTPHTTINDLAGASAETSAPAVAANSEGIYRVIVLDNDGAPVQGAMVQFCDDSTCMLGLTDNTGTAAFPDAQAGHPYTTHILKAPAGYEPNEQEYEALDTFCDVHIILQKTD